MDAKLVLKIVDQYRKIKELCNVCGQNVLLKSTENHKTSHKEKMDIVGDIKLFLVELKKIENMLEIESTIIEIPRSQIG